MSILITPSHETRSFSFDMKTGSLIKCQEFSQQLHDHHGKTSLASTMETGFLALSGKLPTSQSNTWDDAIKYCRAVIKSPQDTEQRANAEWSRSISVLCKELLTRFGAETVECARIGCKAFVENKYHGRALDIAHIDKNANTERYLHGQKTCDIFDARPSILATACYEQTALCCSILLSAWLPAELAVKAATIAHVAVCDDYYALTSTETRAREEMIAVAVGAACESNAQMANLVVDGTALQAHGTGHELSISSIMAWRAVGGCTTPYSSYIWGFTSLENGLVAPEVVMAMHDLLNWRCDAAALNHENGVSAVYGLGYQQPFHIYLEAMLNRASTHPVSGAYAMACIVHLHFTSVRYGSYHYKSQDFNLHTCDRCIRLLQYITQMAELQWAPEPPPDSFEAGELFRLLTRRVVGNSESHSRAQYGISWLQYLIVSGRIELFDATRYIDPLDDTVDSA